MRHEGTKGVSGANLARFSLRAFVPSCLRACVCILGISILIGCTDNKKEPSTRPLTMEERQAQMINDPFNSNQDNGKVDITGGDIWHFDKDAFKKDVDHVFSP